MNCYLDLLRHTLEHGQLKSDRTRIGTISIFGYQMRINLQDQFPLLTTKKIHVKSIIYELLWFLKGDTNIRWLNQHGVTIWNEWADTYGDLGPIYGRQWRSWPAANGVYIDQIDSLVKNLKNHPDSRRHLVCAWNVGELDNMALPPCHVLFQFYVANNKLSCQLYQRSADLFLGVPFNIASYALLTLMLAQVCGLQPGEFIHTFGDAHIYTNHIEQVKTQLQREPKTLPIMHLNPQVTDLFSFDYSDFSLENYHPDPRITAPIAV